MTPKPKTSKQEFESPLPHDFETTKPAPIVGFRFLERQQFQNSAMKYIHFKPARLVKGSKRWYIEFYYRVPEELKPLHKNKTWERFRVFEDINRYKTDEYAEMLLNSINTHLKNGYNPFEVAQKHHVLDFGGDKELTLQDGIQHFKKLIGKKGLDEKTVIRYNNVADLVKKWFVEKNIYTVPLEKVRKKHITTMLSELKEKREWSNRQYNNIKGYTSTIFETLKKAEVIKENPCTGIEKLKQTSRKHQYYDAKTFKKMVQVLQTVDPYLWTAAQFVYYLCVRSSKELRLLKIGDIQDEQFRFRPEVSKSDREDYVPIDPHLQKVIKAMNLPDDPDLFIFGAKQQPATKPVCGDYFSSRFAKIRKEAGLSIQHSLMGFRHTRATHLIKDGVKLSDISRLMRHTDIATTATYIRNLAVDFDSADLLSKSRSI